MKMREQIQRLLIETHQVTQSRRYMWLVAIYGLVILASVTHVFQPEYRQMRCVRKHIEDIRPQWDEFKRANSGFDAVELLPEYDEASGVAFAARGSISPDANQLRLYEFMWGTKPPCSVDIDRLTTERWGIPTAPAMRKVVTLDGRRVVVLVPAKPDPGAVGDSARSAIGPGGPTHGSQPTPSPTNRAASGEPNRP